MLSDVLKHAAAGDRVAVGQRRPLSCLLPDYVLARIVETLAEGEPGFLARGERSDERRSRLARAALVTLTTTGSLKVARVGQAELQRGSRQVRRRVRAARWQAGAAPTCTKDRIVYDAGNRQRLPGTPARREGEAPTSDVAVDEAYDGLGATFDLFCDAYGRNSLDNEGMTLEATVHYGVDYDNAFWDGEQMVFGDGDGEVFNRFTIAVDVIGHELTHGVTEHEAGLVYFKQPGALNEHLSDVFGSLVKQYTTVPKQTAQEADWLIGEGLFNRENVPGATALRSMKEPGTAYDDPLVGTDPQPAHMRDYVNTLEDSGGVHINSGIPNRAFYLAASEIGGYAWEVTGEIWYQALLNPALRPFANFERFARLTAGIAAYYHGRNSPEANAVRDAWTAVGILNA